MKNIIISVFAILLLFGSSPAVAADNLGTVIRKSGWEKMIGTWGDAETRGKKYKSTTKWKFKNHVIESLNENLKEGKKELSLIGYNPKKKESFHISTDNQGGSSIGNWVFNENEATLNIGFVTGNKQEGFLKIQYTFLDDNTMEVTIVLPDPIVIKMIRIEE